MSDHTPVMPAGLVLDCRAKMIDRILDEKDGFDRQTAFMLASSAGQVPSNGAFDKNPEVEALVAKHMPTVKHMASQLRVAEAYRVSPDMSAMVQFAASQLDASDVVDTSLAPTGCGFVRLDKPLPVQDIRGKAMLIHWLVWGPYRAKDGNTCTAVWSFNDPTSHPDDTHYEMMAVAEADMGRGEWYSHWVGRFATVGVDFLFDGNPIREEMIPASPRQMAEVLAEGVEPAPGTNTVRYIHALWLLLNQTVTKVEEERADRPARRRAEKARLPQKVTVIRLRREVSTLDREHGESLVEWQHRWVVRGFWRWQPVGEHYPGAVETEKGYRARIWINPYVKGPADKPFHQSEKVYSLDR